MPKIVGPQATQGTLNPTRRFLVPLNRGKRSRIVGILIEGSRCGLVLDTSMLYRPEAPSRYMFFRRVLWFRGGPRKLGLIQKRLQYRRPLRRTPAAYNAPLRAFTSCPVDSLNLVGYQRVNISQRGQPWMLDM